MSFYQKIFSVSFIGILTGIALTQFNRSDLEKLKDLSANEKVNYFTRDMYTGYLENIIIGLLLALIIILAYEFINKVGNDLLKKLNKDKEIKS